MSRWVDGCIAKQSARLYHKAHRARGSDYARTVKVEPGAMETREEHARDTNYAPIWVSREGRANCWGTSSDVQDYRDRLVLEVAIRQAGSGQQWARPKRAGPKLARFFRAKILTTQPALKTGPVEPNSLFKAKKNSGGPCRAKFGLVFFGPII